MNATNIIKSFRVNKLLSVYKLGVFETLSINLYSGTSVPSKKWIDKFKKHYDLRGYKGKLSFFMAQNDFIVVFEGVDITSDLLLHFLNSISGLISTVNFRLCDVNDNQIDYEIKRDLVYCFADELLDTYNYHYSCSD